MEEQQLYHLLKHKERIIFKYVLKNKDKVAYMSIRELALNCGVSSATVLRFVKKINFSNYKEFKCWCLSEEKTQKFNYHTEEIINCLKKTSDSLFLEKIEEAANLISESDLVLFGGVGNSAASAMLGARYFSNFGLFAIFLNDPFYNFETLPNKTIFILFTSSGETKELIRIAEEIIKQNIPIICITSDEDSILGQMADLTLAYYFKKKRKNKVLDMASQIPAIHIVELLAHKIKSNKM